MHEFKKALEAWGTDAFQRVLKHEIENLNPGILPLEKGLTQGGHVDNSAITATILSTSEDTNQIKTKVGVFFTEIVGGCNCNDDPFEANAYCEMIFNISKTTAKANIIILTS